MLYIFNLKNSDFNLNRSISACMVAQKKISESFDPDRAREYCKEEIKKKIDYYFYKTSKSNFCLPSLSFPSLVTR